MKKLSKTKPFKVGQKVHLSITGENLHNAYEFVAYDEEDMSKAIIKDYSNPP